MDLYKFQLSNTEIYCYTQTTHFLQHLENHSDLVKMTSVKYLCKNLNLIPGHISENYTELNSKPINLLYMVKWERDMDKEMYLNGWYKLPPCMFKLYVNTLIIEVN